MSRVIFMCGPAGSGKTTYARRLEEQGMTRLSFDVEMWRRGLTEVPLPATAREEIETHLRARTFELIADGVDVVLDFSFWSRQMRDQWRRLLEPPASCRKRSTSLPTARRCCSVPATDEDSTAMTM